MKTLKNHLLVIVMIIPTTLIFYFKVGFKRIRINVAQNRSAVSIFVFNISKDE